MGLGLASAAVFVFTATAFAAVLAVGDEVPDVAIQTCDGKECRLATKAEKVVVLFFYGTWQKKAAEEAAKVDGLRKGREKQKLEVIGVARDAKAEDAKKFGDEHKLGFTQACDPKGALYNRFSEKGLPYVVVIDGKRKLKYSAGGADTTAVGKVLTDLLGKAQDPADRGLEKPK
jgi:peroxiredoxin